MRVLPGAIKRILLENRKTIDQVMVELQDLDCTDKAVIYLVGVSASLRTLEVLIDDTVDRVISEMQREQDKGRGPLPGAVVDVEDDDPDNEDRDIRKAAEETAHRFFA